MAQRWSAGVALALLALLCDPVQAQSGWDGSFGRATAGTATSAFDVHGDQLVWASQTGSRTDLILTDLDSLDNRVLTSIVPAGGDALRVQDLGFDGRWVAWCDDRFGDFEVFAFDTQTSTLRRITESSGDDVEVAVEGPLLAWSRDGHIWLHDLGNGTTWPMAAFPSERAYQPTLDGQAISWIAISGVERFLSSARLDGGDRKDLDRQGGSFVRHLDEDGGLLAWDLQVLADPAAPLQGFAGTVLRALRPGASSPENLTDLLPPIGGGAVEVTFAVGGGRVAWIDPASEGRDILVWDGHGRPEHLQAHAVALAASDSHLVALGQGAAGGALFIRPWERSGGSVLSPAPPALAAVGLALAAALLRRR